MTKSYLKGNAQLIRSLNRRLVFHAIKQHGKISRADLVRLIGVKPSTITSIIQEFMREGLVQEGGTEAIKTVGRRPTMLSLNPNYGHSLGIYMKGHYVEAGLIRIDGHLTALTRQDYPENSSPQTVVNAINQAVLQLPRSHHLLGVGVTIAGFVQSHRQKIVYSPSLNWDEVKFGLLLEDHFEVPIYMDNDVNALAVGERWFGAARQFQDFICVAFGEGVGAGIYLNDNLFVGSEGGAGEFGHTCIQRDGPLCRCGQKGCVETMTSDTFLIREAKRHNLPEDPSELVKLASEGHAQSLKIFEQLGGSLGVGLRNLVNLFNPQAIIIGGDRIDAFGFFQEKMKEATINESFSRLTENLQILPASLGKNGWIIGAATLPLRERFSPATLTDHHPAVSISL